MLCIFSGTNKLTVDLIRLMLFDQCIDGSFGLIGVKISNLERLPVKKCTYEVENNIQPGKFKNGNIRAIFLQLLHGILVELNIIQRKQVYLIIF